MMAEQAGSGERQSARMSQACGTAAGILGEGPRRLEADAPAVLHEQQRRQIRHTTSARMQARARDDAKESRVEVPERRQHAGDEDRFRDAIQRYAVEGTADAIGPQQRGGRQKSPERIHWGALYPAGFDDDHAVRAEP